VLSGKLDDDTNAYHVVILADIPDDEETVLDGLTISGGMGADSAGTITIKGYPIDKQSGAGLYLVNASPVLTNVRVQENIAIAGNGGGIYNLATGGGTSSPRLIGGTVLYNNTVKGTGSGGGMSNFAAAGSICEPEISNVIFELNSTAGHGGGMYNIAAADASCKPKITGGTTFRRNGAASGGGVFNDSYSKAEFDNVSVEGNMSGERGGGIFHDENSYTTIKNTTIAGNISSGYGGGLGTYATAWVELTNVTISGNRSTGGGGVFMGRSSVVMTNVKIEDNYSSSSGGGIFMEAYNPSTSQRSVFFINNGIIRGNKAENGGGIFVRHTATNGSGNGSYMVMTNVLIADNTATSTGGGIYNENGITATNSSTAGHGIRVRLTNVTIAGNEASGDGGGIWNQNKNSGENYIKVSVYNSVIWGNNGTSNVRSASDRITYFNSLVQGLDLSGSNGNFNGDSTGPWGSNSPLDGNYKLGAYAGTLLNGGDDNNYNYLRTSPVTTGIGDTATTNVLTILSTMAGATVSQGNIPAGFDNSVGRSIVNWLSSDATSAQGDLTHTVTVNGPVGPSMTVTVSPANIGAVTNTRIKGSPTAVIDVGAYEKE
jgi:hypothetical protein